MFFRLGLYAIAVVMLGLPQLAFALIGGFLSRKFRIPERPDQTSLDSHGGETG